MEREEALPSRKGNSSAILFVPEQFHGAQFRECRSSTHQRNDDLNDVIHSVQNNIGSEC